LLTGPSGETSRQVWNRPHRKKRRLDPETMTFVRDRVYAKGKKRQIRFSAIPPTRRQVEKRPIPPYAAKDPRIADPRLRSNQGHSVHNEKSRQKPNKKRKNILLTYERFVRTVAFHCKVSYINKEERC
jgi:hypothetical protein